MKRRYVYINCNLGTCRNDETRNIVKHVFTESIWEKSFKTKMITIEVSARYVTLQDNSSSKLSKKQHILSYMHQGYVRM